MKIKPELIYLGSCFLTLAMVVSGCAVNQAKGPIFSLPASPKSGQALIYIYRPPNEQYGYSRIYYVQANGNPLKGLRHGGYYPYETNPGHVQIISGGKDTFFPSVLVDVANAVEIANVKAAKLDFDAEAGRIYYVKLHPEVHAAYFQPQLFLMTTNDGENEIKACKLVTE